jgi:hypothetical protein
VIAAVKALGFRRNDATDDPEREAQHVESSALVTRASSPAARQYGQNSVVRTLGVNSGSVCIIVPHSSEVISFALDEPQRRLRDFPPHTSPRLRSHVVPHVRRPSHTQRPRYSF